MTPFPIPRTALLLLPVALALAAVPPAMAADATQGTTQADTAAAPSAVWSSMMNNMQLMHQQMAQLGSTTDPKERARLLDEHLQTMQANMQLMMSNNAGCMMGGNGMMSGQGGMMGYGMMSGGNGVMGHRNMMQMMLEQMQQHQQALQKGSR